MTFRGFGDALHYGGRRYGAISDGACGVSSGLPAGEVVHELRLQVASADLRSAGGFNGGRDGGNGVLWAEEVRG